MFEPIILYQPSREHDLVVSAWWARLVAGPDAERTFTPSVTDTLSAFLGFFQQPKHLVFKLDTVGIWFAAWLEPVMSGAYFGLWIREDRRHSKLALVAFEESLSIAFTIFPVLIGVTRQPDLIDGHKRLGYTLLGQIPYLWDDTDVYIMFITKDAFNSRSTQAVLPYNEAH